MLGVGRNRRKVVQPCVEQRESGHWWLWTLGLLNLLKAVAMLLAYVFALNGDSEGMASTGPRWLARAVLLSVWLGCAARQTRRAAPGGAVGRSSGHRTARPETPTSSFFRRQEPDQRGCRMDVLRISSALPKPRQTYYFVISVMPTVEPRPRKPHTRLATEHHGSNHGKRISAQAEVRVVRRCPRLPRSLRGVSVVTAPFPSVT